MPTLKIVQVGDPVLRRPARPLTADELRSDDLRRLITLMRDTMRDAPGVGLAAPQIGEGIQLLVVEDRPEYVVGLAPERLAERERAPVPFHVLANPSLTVIDESPRVFFEGCLSLSGFGALAPRATAVRVTALDQDAAPIEIEARGWYARILQHEIDHLNGTLYVDRMLSRSFMADTAYRRHWADRPVAEICAALGLAAPA